MKVFSVYKLLFLMCICINFLGCASSSGSMEDYKYESVWKKEEVPVSKITSKEVLNEDGSVERVVRYKDELPVGYTKFTYYPDGGAVISGVC